MNSLKKDDGTPLLNFEGDPGAPLLNFEGGSGSQCPEVPGPGVLVSLLHHASNQEMNVTEKLFPDLFQKNQNWAYLWINHLKFCTICFYCMPGWGLSTYIETTCRPFAFTSYRAFLINKKRPGISLSALICAWFLKKIACVVLLY